MSKGSGVTKSPSESSWASVTAVSALFSRCTFLHVFGRVTKACLFSTAGVEPGVLLPVDLRGIFVQRSIKNGWREGCRKVFPASPVAAAALYGREVQSLPFQGCDAPDSSRGEGMHQTNICSSGSEHRDENVSLRTSRISFLWMMGFGSCEKNKANWFNSN